CARYMNYGGDYLYYFDYW
nr:immunoglobulin heavy chain junction region [Macaca mulatta]MOW89976.1 immunoglobulin heavy chain junction region [Macaca mulatta]